MQQKHVCQGQVCGLNNKEKRTGYLSPVTSHTRSIGTFVRTNPDELRLRNVHESRLLCTTRQRIRQEVRGRDGEEREPGAKACVVRLTYPGAQRDVAKGDRRERE